MSKYSGALRTVDDNTSLPATLALEDGRVKVEVGSTEIGDWPLDDVVFEKIPSGYKLEAEGEHVLFDLDSADALAIGVLLNAPQPKAKSRTRRKKDVDTAPPAHDDSRPPKRDQKEKTGGLLRRRKKDRPQAEEEMATPPMEPQADPEPEIPPAAPVPEPAQAVPTEDISDPEPETDTERAESPGNGKLARIVDKILDVSEARLGPYLPKWVFSRLTVLILFIALVAALIFPGFMSTVLLVIAGLLIALGAVVYTDSAASSRFLYGRTTPTHVFIVGIMFLALGIGLAVLAA